MTTAMSGRLAIYDMKTQSTVEERHDHKKYVVRVVAHEDEDGAWIATAAWAARVLVYRLGIETAHLEPNVKLYAPQASVTLTTNPESIAWINHPELSLPVLLTSRRDSTFLYYYGLPPASTITSNDTGSDLVLLGRQNLAPHANAWISFTPCSIETSPLDASVVAVVTNAVPHMKLLVVRLLLPPPHLSQPMLQREEATQAAQARASLALQDREAAAIAVECNTFAPQTPYSTPTLAWRPDGTGIWVNGDDGVVRGIEVATGKVVAKLKDGHETGSKVRCLWAGIVADREWLVSGGFDRRLIVWRDEKAVT